jgi:hypothetical protein
MTNRRTRIQISRKGNSSMELAIFLPFLCLFLMAIFAVVSVTLSHCKVEMTARYEVWKYRHTPWKAKQTEDIGPSVGHKDLAILDGHTRVSPSRFIVTKSKFPIMQFLKGLTPKTATSRHVVLGGVWDHREIKFAKRSQHPRLVLMDKVNFFSCSCCIKSVSS